MFCSTPNCNCKTTPCGCEQGIPSAPFCGNVTCPNPEPCSETWSDCCVIHNGDSFTWVPDVILEETVQFNVLQGERLCDTLQRFIAFYNCNTDPATVPYGLKSTNITSTTLTIAWTPITAALTAYEIFITPVSTGTFVSAGTVPPSTTPSFTITGLTANTSYYVKVRANNGADVRCSSVSLILTTKLT